MPHLKPIRGTVLSRPDDSPMGRLTASLKGYWLMNEGTGKTAFDLSSNGNSGTLINTPTWSTGRYGSALNFNGSDDYIQIARPSNAIISTNFTIGGFVNTTSTAPDNNYSERIITFFRSEFASTRFALGLKGTKANLLYVTSVPDFGNLTSSEDYNDGLWHFFLATYDGTTFRLYVDGVEKANATGTLITDNGTRKPEIGMLNALNISAQRGAWDGLIDHVMVFSRALSAREVAQLYREPFCILSRTRRPYLTISQTDSLAGAITCQSALTAALKVTKKLAGNTTGFSTVNGCFVTENEPAAETKTISPPDALFNGMTVNAFKLGTVLSLGWFWIRTNGCSVLYRGKSLDGIDFANILAVTETDDFETSPAAHISHNNDTTYFYIVRRFNGCGQQEYTLAATAKVSIDSNGELAEPGPNKVFDSVSGFGGNKIRLVWYYCPIRQESTPVRFNIYYDNRSGQIDYQNPLARIDYKGRKFYSFQSDILEAGNYLFAIKAEDADGIENLSSAQLKIQLNPKAPCSIGILRAEAV